MHLVRVPGRPQGVAHRGALPARVGGHVADLGPAAGELRPRPGLAARRARRRRRSGGTRGLGGPWPRAVGRGLCRGGVGGGRRDRGGRGQRAHHGEHDHAMSHAGSFVPVPEKRPRITAEHHHAGAFRTRPLRTPPRSRMAYPPGVTRGSPADPRGRAVPRQLRLPRRPRSPRHPCTPHHGPLVRRRHGTPAAPASRGLGSVTLRRPWCVCPRRRRCAGMSAEAEAQQAELGGGWRRRRGGRGPGGVRLRAAGRRGGGRRGRRVGVLGRSVGVRRVVRRAAGGRGPGGLLPRGRRDGRAVRGHGVRPGHRGRRAGRGRQALVPRGGADRRVSRGRGAGRVVLGSPRGRLSGLRLHPLPRGAHAPVLRRGGRLRLAGGVPVQRGERQAATDEREGGGDHGPALVLLQTGELAAACRPARPRG
ncbi:hypothetical protein SHJG_5345 [Streptomyces hygroscopicus subsp. jinggangensis 5008]|nr:hypothetical protein SHJG_5345 [Streptomyces hygroscopicus subsp. jinggangensis 5008]AGF64772.1 hypothetical protein SHJGH_5109 [Streptomyces hygroscopicus subsp. jinggangensis TL01]